MSTSLGRWLWGCGPEPRGYRFLRQFFLTKFIFSTNNGTQIAPLGFDTIVTLMTICKAFYVRRRNGGPSSRLIQTFLREGVFYYLLISIANLVCRYLSFVLPLLTRDTTIFFLDQWHFLPPVSTKFEISYFLLLIQCQGLANQCLR